MLSLKHYLIAIAVLIALAFAAATLLAPLAEGASGSGKSGFATSSTIGVGPQEDKTLFTSNRTCGNRVITTVASPVMLSFHSAVNPSGTVGHQQAASTTVSYESDDFGCTAVTAYAFSSTTITITEFSY